MRVRSEVHADDRGQRDIGFQDRVAGLLAVHVVADAPVDFFGLPSHITPTSIELETSAPVDDILVETSAPPGRRRRARRRYQQCFLTPRQLPRAARSRVLRQRGLQTLFHEPAFRAVDGRGADSHGRGNRVIRLAGRGRQQNLRAFYAPDRPGSSRYDLL
jgi:hypothetical protein